MLIHCQHIGSMTVPALNSPLLFSMWSKSTPLQDGIETRCSLN